MVLKHFLCGTQDLENIYSLNYDQCKDANSLHSQD